MYLTKSYARVLKGYVSPRVGKYPLSTPLNIIWILFSALVSFVTATNRLKPDVTQCNPLWCTNVPNWNRQRYCTFSSTRKEERIETKSGREKLGLKCVEGISGRKWLRENVVGQFAQNMTEVLEIVRHNAGFVNVLLHCSLTGISMEYLRLRVIMNYHFLFVFLSMYDGDKLLNVITILSLFEIWL